MSLNAFITTMDEQLVADGPLSHLRVGIKDMYDTAGVRTTAGSAQFKDRIPDRDAVAVAKLKAAGARLVGKTNMHRLGMGTTSLVSDFGPVHNPRNEDFVAGGSSGGSAAAVAADLCDVTLDTDAIGSCRLPAACCGVVGFKPTYKFIDNTGVFGGIEASDVILMLAHAAVMARCVANVKLMVETLTGKTLDDPGAHPRIGVMFGAAVDGLEAIGSVRDVEPDIERNYFDIRNVAEDRAHAASSLFPAVDVLVMPTLAAPVPTIAEAGDDENAVSPHHTIFANYFGLPAITVPCGVDHRGMPIGLQIVGKPGDDATVLSVAARFEAAR